MAPSASASFSPNTASNSTPGIQQACHGGGTGVAAPVALGDQRRVEGDPSLCKGVR